MLSIIMPIYNQHEMTAEALQEILDKTQDFELILIDNGSDPPIKPPFTGFIKTRLIRNEENIGFPAAVNQGIKEADGDIICLMNNDIFVPSGWAERLLIWFETYDVVGPCTGYAAGIQNVNAEGHPVQIGYYSNLGELSERAFEAWEENEGLSYPVNFVIGFCMAFKKSVSDDIGFLDESLWPCSGEEIDWCFRAREKGYKIGVAFDCYVHHEGSKTFTDMENAGLLNYGEICDRNDKHLAEKWGDDFWARQIMQEPENEAEKAIA